MSDTLLDASRAKNDWIRKQRALLTAEAILKAAGNSLMRHGNDPASDKILLAALAMAVEHIELKLRPGFTKALVEMLKP